MNGNLVSPIHVLANAEVVEIITYDVSIPFIDNMVSFCSRLFTILQCQDTHIQGAILVFSNFCSVYNFTCLLVTLCS